MKTILITGASSGIGRAAAVKLADSHRLILCSRNKKIINSQFELLPNVLTFEIDVRKFDEVERMFANLDQKNIAPDVVINSAGLALGLEELDESDPNDWNQMIDTNVKGLLNVSGLALKRMKKVGKGHIINIGSIAGINSYAKGVVYAATKSAVKSISDGLRKEVVASNIKITNIQPGLVDTNFSNTRFYGDNQKAKAVYQGIQPLTANDIAEAILYALNTPEHVQINEITLTPTNQASVELIHRNI